jgi:hypothetical protein
LVFLRKEKAHVITLQRTVFLFALALTACSGQVGSNGQSIPAAAQQSASGTPSSAAFASVRAAALAAKSSNEAVENVFAQATNKSLADSDIETYIDPRVTGAERTLAHQLLAQEPANLRGDFAYMGSDGRVISNNPDLIPYIQVTRGQVARAAPGRIAASSNPRYHAMNYSSPCSPPNPGNAPQGAYDREVAVCGFDTGWAFAEIPCGTSYMPSGDSGNMYFETYGTQGSTMEGGLEYYSDISIAPYARQYNVSTNVSQYETMQNNTTRYSCGNIMGIFSGLTLNTYQTYTVVGQLAAGLDPETEYVSGAVVQLVDPSWLWFPATSDMTGSSTDAAGNPTPCIGCSVSQVTTIAQNNVQTYAVDGSYFGIDGAGDNAIHWMQVAFGNWTAGCVSGASSCPFAASRNPFVYYGGQQDYPDSCVSEAITNPLGYGVYETYDGIDLTGDSCSAGYVRAAAGPFGAPTAPPATPTPSPTATPAPTAKPTAKPTGTGPNCVKDPSLCDGVIVKSTFQP